MTNNYKVILSSEAQKDILDIWNFNASGKSAERADEIYGDLKNEINRLSAFPEKGQLPFELERVDVYEFRQVHCKTYRIIYAVENRTVLIYAVIDGRRDVQTALLKRLCRF